MEPTLVAFFTSLGLPAGLSPDSLTLVGLAGCVGGLLVLWRARREGADVSEESRALAIAFAGSWMAAMLFELPWALPAALASGSVEPLRGVDRNLLGGILGGAGGAGAWLWLRSTPILPHLDRSVWLWTTTIVCTRLGCVLEGCNFGRPTTALLGWIYPPGSMAAMDHAARGWVPPGAASLPVHPTAMYEIVLALLVSLIVWRWPRRKEVPGAMFLAWLGLYAAGRFVLEGMRADAIASPIPGLARGQLLCLAVLGASSLFGISGFLMRLRPRSFANALLVALLLTSVAGRAQTAQAAARKQAATRDASSSTSVPRGTASPAADAATPSTSEPAATQGTDAAPTADAATPSTSEPAATQGTVAAPTADATTPSTSEPAATQGTDAAPTADATTPGHSHQAATEEVDDAPLPPELVEGYAFRFSAGRALRFGETAPVNGTFVELDVLKRLDVRSPSRRGGIGMNLRFHDDIDSRQWTVGVPLELAQRLGRFDLNFGFIPGLTQINFASRHFPGGLVFGTRFHAGAQIRFSNFSVGVSPLAFQALWAEDLFDRTLLTYEPRVWVSF